MDVAVDDGEVGLDVGYGVVDTVDDTVHDGALGHELVQHVAAAEFCDAVIGAGVLSESEVWINDVHGSSNI